MSESSVDNGVNVQALLDARNALADAPEAATFTWRAGPYLHHRSGRVAAGHRGTSSPVLLPLSASGRIGVYTLVIVVGRGTP